MANMNLSIYYASHLFMLVALTMCSMEHSLAGMSADSSVYKELWEPCTKFLDILQDFSEAFNNLDFMTHMYSGMHGSLHNIDLSMNQGLINYAKWIRGTSSDMEDVHQKMKGFTFFYNKVMEECIQVDSEYRDFMLNNPTDPRSRKIQLFWQWNQALLKILQKNLDFWKELWKDSGYKF